MSRTSQSEFKGDTRVESEKTAAKLSIDHGDCKTTYGFANDKMTFDAVGKALDSDGWRAKVGASGEAKQAKDEWKVTASADVSSPDLGGIKAALNVSSATASSRQACRAQAGLAKISFRREIIFWYVLILAGPR